MDHGTERSSKAVLMSSSCIAGSDQCEFCGLKLSNSPSCNVQGMAEQGKLGKLTVNDLKKYCEANQLTKSGKKDDIIDRIKKHMGLET